MGMQKEKFEKLLEPLGYFKKKWGDGNDDVFIPHPTSNLCIVCKNGWTLTIEKKYGYKEQPYWRVKCGACKNHWQKTPL